MNDFSVKIAYRNRSLENVGEETYDFEQYSEMMKKQQTRIIVDVEDLLYYLQDNKSKDEWDEGTMVRFQHIRHKLLDQANAIERLPRNLYYKGVNCASISSSEMVARIIDSLSNK